jgi:DNA-binding SARP family transcriptional activator
MSLLRVSLFGRFNVECDQLSPTQFAAGKAKELFCYLLLYRDRPHPREKLADVLWEDTPPRQSKRYLRKTLWQLQTVLAPQVDAPDVPMLVVETDWIQINPDANLWLDVAIFEQAFSGIRGVPGSELEAHHVRALRDATSLYQGDLLEGWYQDWCLFERERLQSTYLSMLDKLMGHCEAHLRWEEGLTYGTQILRFDRARERAHRRLMRLHYLAGNRTAALRQYDRCVAALGEELGVGPSKRTRLLHNEIRTDTPQEMDSVPADTQEASLPLLVGVLNSLRQVGTVLDEAKYELEREIEAVKSSLDRAG